MSGVLPFDLEAFLSEAGQGTTKSIYEEHKVIFSQGETADSIFYINFLSGIIFSISGRF